MNVHIAQIWIEIFLFWMFGFSGIYAILHFRRKKQERFTVTAKNSLKTYVFNGKEDKAFHSLGDTLTTTARNWRGDYLEESRREKENDAINYGFSFVCSCPRCGSINSHNFTGNQGGRECKECEYKWHIPV